MGKYGEDNMPELRDPELSDEEELVLDLLDDEALRIEDISREVEMEYDEVQDTVHNLWRENLVVSGPEFEFEADRGVPPNLR